jgi:hypothetical protein
LFGRAYVIRELVLEGLSVRIVRELSGRWTFPSVVPVPGGSSDESGLRIERVRLTDGRVRVFEFTPRDGMQETSAITDVSGEAVSDAAGLRISPLRGTVGGSPITGEALVTPKEARVDFAMERIDGQDLKAVLGLTATGAPEFLTLPKPAAASFSIRIDRAKSRLSGTGSLRAPEVGFYTLRVQGLEAPIKTDGVKLTFDPATFTMYGGTHRGTTVVDLSRIPARWTLNSKVGDLNVGDFLSALTGRDRRVDGTGSATVVIGAGVGEPMPRSLEGRMHVNVVNGIIREFPMLAAINRALQLAEGDTRDTRFERLSATLVFAGRLARTAAEAAGSGHVTTDDLVIDAREVRVQASGRIGFDRSLDLSGVAVVSPERSASAIRSVRELSGLRNERGELEIPLTITGTLDEPFFGIDLKAVVARSIEEELRRRLRRFLRRQDPDAPYQ